MSTQPILEQIKKIAWAWHNCTSLEVDELIGEISVAYAKALSKHDPALGNLNTQLWSYSTNQLCSFLRVVREKEKHEIPEEVLPENKLDGLDPSILFLERLAQLGPNGRRICQLILESPSEFDVGKEELQKMLRQRGWSWKNIWGVVQEIKIFLKEK